MNGQHWLQLAKPRAKASQGAIPDTPESSAYSHGKQDPVLLHLRPLPARYLKKPEVGPPSGKDMSIAWPTPKLSQLRLTLRLTIK